MAPTPPNARQRPGKRRGAPRLRAGAPKWPPHPPTLGSAPANAVALLDSGRGPRNGPHTPQRSAAPRQTPWRSSTQGGGPEMAPTPPNARPRPGNAGALLRSAGTPPAEQAEAAHGHPQLAV